METTQITKRDELAQCVGQVQAGFSLVAWSLESLATGANPPEPESRQFELYTGMVFVLELLAQRLGDVYRELSAENPAVGG